MAPMQPYLTDAWEPLALSTESTNMQADKKTSWSLRDMETQHYLGFLAMLLFLVVAPIAWFVTGLWAVACLVAGLALFALSMAAILTPEPADELGRDEPNWR